MQQVLDIDACVRRAQTDFSGAFDRVIHFRKMGHATVFSCLERYLKLTDFWLNSMLHILSHFFHASLESDCPGRVRLKIRPFGAELPATR